MNSSYLRKWSFISIKLSFVQANLNTVSPIKLAPPGGDSEVYVQHFGLVVFCHNSLQRLVKPQKESLHSLQGNSALTILYYFPKNIHCNEKVAGRRAYLYRWPVLKPGCPVTKYVVDITMLGI